MAPPALNQAYNIAVGRRTTLDELFLQLRDRLAARHPQLAGSKPTYGPVRPGDVMHSLADIGKARRLLRFEPTHSIEQGLDESLGRYETHLRP
jgi:UDP-N-acetylglucosamine 4-epimerase